MNKNTLYSAALALLLFCLPVGGEEGQDPLIGLPRFPAAKTSTTIEQVNQGAEMLARGESLQAEEVLGAALQENPTSAEAAYNFGLALAFNGKFAEALHAQRQALELKPAFPEANLAVGTILLSTGDSQGALEAFSRTLEQDPDAAVRRSAVFNKGVVLGRLKRFPEAEMCFSESLILAPEDPSSAFQLGQLQLQQEHWRDGIDWLETCLEAYPLEANTLMARALLHLEKYPEATNSIAAAEKALENASLADDVRAQLTQHLQELKDLAAAKTGQ